MGSISAEVLSQLAKGISEVIKTESGGESLANKANTIAAQAEQKMAALSSFQFGFGGYRSVKDVVNEAASKVEKDFMITGIKTRMGEVFAQLRHNGFDGFEGDHSSGEDQQLLSILKNKKIELTEEMQEKLLQVFQEYYNLSKQVAKANQAIYQNNDFINLRNDAATIMQQGYQVLTEIGEHLRNTQIIYEVQVSVGSKGSQRTAYLTLDQISQYTTAAYYNGEMRLRLNEAAINADAAAGKLQVFNWTDAYRQSYQKYVTRAIESEFYTPDANWANNKTAQNLSDIYINRGNVTEAFRRAAAAIAEKALDSAFQHTLDELEGMADTWDIHYLIHTQIEETLKNTTAFWQGPDFTADLEHIFNGLIIDDQDALLNRLGINPQNTKQIGVQEKVSGASFTSLSQIATQLRKAANALMVIQSKTGGNSVLPYIDSSVAEGVDEEVEQAVLELVSQFLGA